MLTTPDPTRFAPLNKGFSRTFQPGRLSLGLVVPLEAYPDSAVPSMRDHLARVQMAEQLGFSAVWLRDVPFNVPSFGDAGQVFDPFVYLGLLAGATQEISLGVASVILPLRHPAHVAKAAASADVLSEGRLLLGVASGDRPEEYPAMNMSFEDRAERFRDSVAYIRGVGAPRSEVTAAQGRVQRMDLLPKPTGPRLPLLVTGSSRQSPAWIAEHSDGWITYPRSVPQQQAVIDTYRSGTRALGLPDKPVMQSLYVDLSPEADAPPSPIHLGFRSGTDALIAYLREIEAVGVNHVALNLRFSSRSIEDTLHHLADAVLPAFAS